MSPDHIEALKKGFYETKVVVTTEEARQIEEQTKEQADSQCGLLSVGRD